MTCPSLTHSFIPPPPPPPPPFLRALVHGIECSAEAQALTEHLGVLLAPEGVGTVGAHGTPRPLQTHLHDTGLVPRPSYTAADGLHHRYVKILYTLYIANAYQAGDETTTIPAYVTGELVTLVAPDVHGDWAARELK